MHQKCLNKKTQERTDDLFLFNFVLNIKKTYSFRSFLFQKFEYYICIISDLFIQKREKCMSFLQYDRCTIDLIARNNECAIRIKMTYVHFHFVLHAYY